MKVMSLLFQIRGKWENKIKRVSERGQKQNKPRNHAGEKYLIEGEKPSRVERIGFQKSGSLDENGHNIQLEEEK